MNVQTVLLYLTVILQAVFSPLFLKYMWPEKNWKSLTFKMICSTLFVLGAYLSMSVANNFGLFARIVFLGLVCGFVGDFFLGINGHKALFVIGVFFFLFNHLIYCYAFTKARNLLFPGSGTRLVYIIEVISVLVIIGALIIIFKLNGFSLRGPGGLLVIYGFVLSYMLVKATSLGYRLFVTGTADGEIGSGMLVCGALLYFISDVSLGMILLGNIRKYPLKCFNNLTYIVAQMLIGLSLLYIK